MKNNKLSVENFFSIRSTLSPVFSSVDNFVYYITNITGSPQIWRVNSETKIIEQITAEENGVKEIHFNPVYNQIIFSADFKGNENNQLFSLDLNSFQIKYLTKEFEGSQCYFHKFSKDGKKFLFSTNKALKYNFDVYFYNIQKDDYSLVKKFDDKVLSIANSFSDNEKYFTFSKIYHNLDQDILLFDSESKEWINVTQHSKEDFSTNLDTLFDNKCKGFYFLSNDNNKYFGIKYYNINSSETCWVVKCDGDILSFALSENNKELIYVYSKNGRCILKIYNLKSGKFKTIKTPKGVIRNLEYSKSILFVFENPTHPADIYLYKNGIIRKITNSVPAFVNNNSFTEAKDVFLTSFDGMKIHSLLYVPKKINKNKKNPAIIWVHGGPEAQEVHNFNKYIQVLTNEGYIVITPNYRGSTGYGKDFQKLVYKDWGGANYKDVISCIDLLKKIHYVDIKRVGIGGGSFGGYMTLTCITKSMFNWRVAVDIFGPSNLFTFLKTIPEHWKKITDVLVGNIVKDKELLKERSPINFVDNIKCPLLVVQGKHDPRVSENESTQIVNKLKSKNKPVEYILLDDEGHGFSRVKNQIKVFKYELDFLNKYMFN